MRILALAPYLPSPPTFGGQRRLQGVFQALARRHELGLVTLSNPNDDPEKWLAATRAWCPDAIAFRQEPFGFAERQKRIAQLKSIASLKSWDLISHRSELLRAALRAKLAASRWDVILVEFVQMTANLSLAGVKLPPVILDEHNIEFDLQRRVARSAGSIARRTYAEINWRKLRREEVAAWRSVQGISVTSDRDLALIREEVPDARCKVVPNGVDLKEFAPPAEAPVPDTVAFFGAHNYFPNADALRFFFAEIWPKIVARRPGARLRVIGPLPLPEVQARAPADSVVFTGPVASIAAEVGRAAIAIAPLRIGGGTRLKVVEAMALARPMVATRIGAEGLDLENGRDLLLADAPEEFAAAVLRLLENPAEAAELGRRARQRVEALYGWDSCVRGLEELCEEVRKR